MNNKKILFLIFICLVLSFSFSYFHYNKSLQENDNNKEANIKEEDIAVFINGTISSTFPNSASYIPRVECSDNIKGHVTWDGTNNKWLLKTEGTDSPSARCNVYFTAGTQNLKDAILANNNSIKVEDASTLTNQPGKAVSGENEKFLVKTPDDYGNSYIFRGNIDNNYVVFANKCWKIVRITGNNAIKLILQNNNGTDCSVYNAAGKSAFNNAPGVFNTSTGVGFMYGEPNPSGANDNEKYLNAQANTYDSTILTFLKGWYDNVFSASDKNKLADVIWCNDKSLYSGVGYGNTSNTYFNASSRIYDEKSPSLICPNAGSDNKLSKFTASDTTNGNGKLYGYKIGLLNADEVAFAGAIYGQANSNYYLSNKIIWLLSGLNKINGRNTYNWLIQPDGRLDSYQVNEPLYVLPAIALSSTVTYYLNGTGTPGTITNPYIVI